MRRVVSRLAVLGTLALAGTGCPPDGEGWDYRLAIRKDMRNRLKLVCAAGQHFEHLCSTSEVGESCVDECVPNTK